MAITTTKTWQFNLNNYVPPDVTISGTNAHFDRRSMLLGIKNALKGFSTLPWTVPRSCDSVTATTSDLWVDVGDLVWRDDDTASVFSWIVLRQTGISTTFEVLITCEEDGVSNDGAQIGVWVAQAGFTGGTTTARPTATDERLIQDSTLNFWGSGPNGGAGFDYRWHAMQSTDGQCTRVLIFINEVNTGFWLFDKPANPVTGWANPYIAVINGNNDSTTNQCTFTKFHDSAAILSRFAGTGTNTTLFLTSEGFGTNASGETFNVENQVDGSWWVNGMGLASLTTSFVGRVGDVFDLWWGQSVAKTGRYYPDTGTKSYVQVSDMIFPWDGSTIIGTE